MIDHRTDQGGAGSPSRAARPSYARDLYLREVGPAAVTAEATGERRQITNDGGTVTRQVVTPTNLGWTIHTEYNAPRKEHP